MIVHTFAARDADWCLAYHLSVYSELADRIVCVLDRSPESETICRRFPKVEVHHYTPTQNLPDFANDAVCYEEGKLRQLCWDLAARHEPDWVLLADADEVLTPDAKDWVKALDPRVECYYAHWVNLYGDMNHAVGGAGGKWSFQNPRANKKGGAVRVVPGREYRYDLNRTQHNRMEPNPVSPGRAVIDHTHVLVDSPKLIHLKYANWPRWQACPLSKMGSYANLLEGGEVVDVPGEWHWPYPIEGLKA